MSNKFWSLRISWDRLSLALIVLAGVILSPILIPTILLIKLSDTRLGGTIMVVFWLGLILTYLLSENFWYILAIFFLTGLYCHTYDFIESKYLIKAVNSVAPENITSKKIAQVFLGHRLVFLWVFLFLASVSLHSWGFVYESAHDTILLACLLWVIVWTDIERAYDMLYPPTKDLVEAREIMLVPMFRLREGIFFLSVVSISFLVLSLGSVFYPNSFLREVAFAVVISFAVAGLARLHPVAIRFVLTRLNKQGLVDLRSRLMALFKQL